MKTLYYTAATLDGFIADPKHTLDWLLQFDQKTDYDTFIEDVGALAMGATTYLWVLEHLTGPDGKIAWPYRQPTWVFSSRVLPVPEDTDVRLVRGDVRPLHADMVTAAAGKNVWVVGGGELAGQFYDHGLLDELVVTIASVTLGAGSPLLPRCIVTPPLRLLSATAYGESFARLHYAVPKRVEEARG